MAPISARCCALDTVPQPRVIPFTILLTIFWHGQRVGMVPTPQMRSALAAQARPGLLFARRGRFPLMPDKWLLERCRFVPLKAYDVHVSAHAYLAKALCCCANW